MNGTAINASQYEYSNMSRFADSSLATTANPLSLATKMLGGSIYLPWETTSEPKVLDFFVRRIETNIDIGKKAFEYFVQTIANPPARNPKLTSLLCNDFK
jgi:hypothetical protein